MARLAQDLGPESARAALVTMNQPAAMTVRADGYVQDRASQLVAAHVGDPAGRAGPRHVRRARRQGDGAGRSADRAWSWPPICRPAGPPSRPPTPTASTPATSPSWWPTALRPPWRAGRFDRVLVDAPCSGLGVLRRRPDARWRVQPGDVARLAGLQRRLLAAAVPLVRPGGVLVYSVCTLTGEETARHRRLAGPDRPGADAAAAARARRGSPPGGGPGCFPRRPARTGCTSWPCRVPAVG